jgi:hypothetical protein
MKKLTILTPTLLVLVLAGCGGKSSKDDIVSNYCPTPLTVQDAAHLTRFKEGPGRDPRDIVFEADIGGASVSCSLGKNQLQVDLTVRVAATAGPSVAPGQTRVPYFVRVIDSSGSVTQGQDFSADFKLSPASPRGASQEELTLRLPFNKASDLGGYRVAIGLKPTMDELNYNRSAIAR